jgi:hypothetical protein
MTATTTMPTVRRGMHRGFTLLELLIAIGVVILLAAITISATVALGARSDVRATENTLRLLDLAVTAWEEESAQKITWGVDGFPAGATYDMLDGTPHVYTITELLDRIGKSPAAREIIAQIDPKSVYTYDPANPDVPMPDWIRFAGAGTDPVRGDPDPNALTAGTWYTSNMLWPGTPKAKGLAQRLAVLDAWGTPIRAVHPGRAASDALGDLSVWTADELDDDGTIFIDGRNDAAGNALYEVESIYERAAGRRILFVSAGPDRIFGNRSLAESDPGHIPAEDNLESYGRHEH